MAEERQRLFFVTTEFPWPAISGGTLKSSRLIGYLSGIYALELYCFVRPDQQLQVGTKQEKYGWAHAFVEVHEVSRSPLNYLKSLFRAPSLNAFRNHSSKMAREIQSRLSEDDILFIDHLEMMQYVPRQFRGRIIYHSHNAEYLLWKGSARFASGFAKRTVLGFESSRVKKFETESLEKADLIFAAPNDQRALQRLSPTARFATTYHLGDDSLLSKQSISFENTQKVVLYAGSLGWEPNVDALLWFIQSVWPLVLQGEPDARLVIAGKGPDARIQKAAKGKAGIGLAGFVKDLETWYGKSRVFINPQRYGSGMKVKTSEALYRGVPLVTTRTGAEGYELENGREAFIAQGQKEFAEAVLVLLNDRKKWTAMRNAMRDLARSKYTYESLLPQMVLAMGGRR